MIETYSHAWDSKGKRKDNIELNNISKLAKKSQTVWIDLINPNDEDIHILSQELNVHELALEDVLHSHQRPKVDYYNDHCFIVFHALQLIPATGELTRNEISIFIKDNCLVSIRSTNDINHDELLATAQALPHDHTMSVGAILHSFLDFIIDGYLTTVTKFDEYYDEISDYIFEEIEIPLTQQRSWFNTRRSLVQFHRVIISIREALTILLRREDYLIDDQLRPYYYDTYDHVMRVNESADILRELVSTIVDTNISLRDYRQNQIMKQVTSWAAIIAIPTLITGFYGMNVPYPGFGGTIGVAVSIGLILFTSLFLFILFKKRDWL